MTDQKNTVEKSGKETERITVTHKSTMMSWNVCSDRRVEYQVEGVGLVAEQWVSSAGATQTGNGNPDQAPQQQALHRVYIDGKLVRELNMTNGQVVQSDPKYEPYSFLRYGPSQQQASHDAAMALFDSAKYNNAQP